MAPHPRLNRYGILRHSKDQFTGVGTGTGTGVATGTPMGTSATPVRESAVCWLISGDLYGVATGHGRASCGTLKLQPPRYNDSQTPMEPLTHVYKFQQVLCKHNNSSLGGLRPRQSLSRGMNPALLRPSRVASVPVPLGSVLG